ncbi:hypothetical protein DBR11_00350 [Pedobacter sp. HMWF019]|nr:hypothetical protein DBR11_00350 [Pedobacter sp. HMWF019]
MLSKDVAGTIAHIAKIDYNQVETYYGYPGPYATKGFWGLDAKAFGSLLNRHNLTTPSGHYNCLAFLTDGNKDVLKEQMETAAIAGQEYYVIPGLPPPIRQAGLSGLEHLFIEQDVIKIEHYRSIEQSLEYVRNSLIRQHTI